MQDIFIGRQAIFDRKLEVYGYELLFRSDTQNSSQIPARLDGDRATSEVLLNTFMEMGLERIAGPHRVFVNLTRHFFLQLPEIPFEIGRVVLEVLEDIPVDEHLLKAVCQLSQAGHVLALDDYTFGAGWDPLLPHVQIVKVEVPDLSLDSIKNELPRLKHHGLKLLAEKIETQEEYQRLAELGFDYFQGYYFSRPTVIQGRRLDENQMIILRLVSELNKPDVTINELERLISQDAGLSYKILRYINSAAIGMPQPVTSIRRAVILMGLSRIRAWTSLLALCRVDNKPQIHFTTALVRAHMCEQLVMQHGGCPPDTAFTVGLLSILDLLMDRPLTEIVDELALTDEVRVALLEHKGIAGQALRCARAYELQQWDEAMFSGISDAEIIRIYLEASAKAFMEEQALQRVHD
jgi:EAL and modified HD-GYP domain-containing signal transduction protein